MEPSAPTATPLNGKFNNNKIDKFNEPSSVTAQVINDASNGQTLYIRQVQRTIPHKFAFFVNVCVLIAVIGIAIGQIWGMAMKTLGLMEVVMRSYMIAISGLIALNEMGASAVLAGSPILRKFTWRGIFYTFIGTLGTLLNDIGNDDYYNNWNRWNNNYDNNNGYVTFSIPSLEHFLEIFIGVSSVILFGFGCLYILMGFFCAQGLIERDIENYRQRLNLADAALTGEQDVIQKNFGGGPKGEVEVV